MGPAGALRRARAGQPAGGRGPAGTTPATGRPRHRAASRGISQRGPRRGATALSPPSRRTPEQAGGPAGPGGADAGSGARPASVILTAPRHSKHATSLLPHTRHPCPTPRSRQCIERDVHCHPRSDLVFLITFVSAVPGCVTQCGTRLVITIPVPHWVTGAGCGPGTGRGQEGLRDASDGLARAVEARQPWRPGTGNLSREPDSTPAGQDPAKLRVIF